MSKNPKGDLVRSLLAQGKTMDEVQRITGLSRRSVAQYGRDAEPGGMRGSRVWKNKRQAVEDMFRQGAEIGDIMRETGLAKSALMKYRHNMAIEGGLPSAGKQHGWWPLDLQVEWVDTVNVIRRHCGLEPFEVPGGREDRSGYDKNNM